MTKKAAMLKNRAVKDAPDDADTVQFTLKLSKREAREFLNFLLLKTACGDYHPDEVPFDAVLRRIAIGLYRLVNQES